MAKWILQVTMDYAFSLYVSILSLPTSLKRHWGSPIAVLKDFEANRKRHKRKEKSELQHVTNVDVGIPSCG
jgi:hypothetical protein